MENKPKIKWKYKKKQTGNYVFKKYYEQKVNERKHLFLLSFSFCPLFKKNKNAMSRKRKRGNKKE